MTIRCYLNRVETDTNLLSAIKSGNATLFIGQDGWGNIFNGTVDEVKIYNRALSVDEVRADYEAGFEELNSVSGTSPCGTNIANATVTLATLEGDLIYTTQTDSTGNYTFTDISAGTYNLTVTKPRFWPVNTITVTTGNTENVMLWLKGDLNRNGTQADYGDLVMMNYAATGRLIPDWKFDLNGNGDLADAGDVLMLEEAAAGKIELW